MGFVSGIGKHVFEPEKPAEVFGIDFADFVGDCADDHVAGCFRGSGLGRFFWSMGVGLGLVGGLLGRVTGDVGFWLMNVGWLGVGRVGWGYVDGHW